jgi:hypothetical protein
MSNTCRVSTQTNPLRTSKQRCCEEEGFPPPHIVLKSTEGRPVLATTASPTDFINIVAAEMSSRVERAVEYWLAQIDQIVTNDKIALARQLIAVQEVLQDYKRLTGKGHLKLTCME